MNVTLEVVKGRGLPERIVLEAATPSAARAQAIAMGYEILSVQTGGLTLPGLLASSDSVTKLNRTELVLFIEQLGALLKAGLSIIEVLETLNKSGSQKWKALTSQLIDRLREGHRFSDAIEQSGRFPPLLIAMISSSELTSNLPQSLGRFLEHESKTEQVKRHLISVALYPVLLTAVGGAVMLFLLTYVMPRFARIFESMHDLPWSAAMMVRWSHLIKAHGFDMLLAMILLILTVAATMSARAAQVKILRAIVQTPGLAQHIRIYFLTRWYRTVGMLVEGGIPLPDAVHLAGQVLPAGLQSGGLQTERLMREGVSPANSFQQSTMATAVASQLLRAGEKSGDIGKMLTKAAEFHENDISKLLERFMRVFEPVVMTLIGVGIGGVVILMYLPIFELASAIQ